MFRVGVPGKIGTVSKIDNSPPKFDIKKIYFDKKKFTEFGTFTIKKYEDNLKLIQKLHKINRLQARIDCWNFERNDEKTKALDKQRLVNEMNRKSERRAIHLKNREMIEHLAAIKARPTPSIYGFRRKPNFEQSRYQQSKKSLSNIRSKQAVDNNPRLPKIRRTKCFFDLEIPGSDIRLGRIVIKLYNDIAPAICDNFEAFCKTTEKGLTYKGTFIHTIISGYLCQGGDVIERSGWGEASIFDESRKQEKNVLKHDGLGVLSTFNDVNQTFDSKFNITFKPLKYFDGKKIVFGKVIRGAKYLLMVDSFGTKSGFPRKKIFIADCGVLNR